MCFISFWHSSLFVFKKTKNTVKTQRYLLKFVSIILWNLMLFYFFFIDGSFNEKYLFVGIAFSIIALVIYWVCVKSLGDFKLAVIHGNIESNKIYDRGIYKYIRHPFYTSYICCYLGLIICIPKLPVILSVGILLYIYLYAAYSEERHFLSSDTKVKYAEYRKKTGMFFPKLF